MKRNTKSNTNSSNKKMWVGMALSAALLAPLSMGQVGGAASADLDGQGSASAGDTGGNADSPYSPMSGSLAPFFGKKVSKSATNGDKSFERLRGSSSGPQALTLGSGDMTATPTDGAADEPSVGAISGGLLPSAGKFVSKTASAGEVSLGPMDDGGGSPYGGIGYTPYDGEKAQGRASASDLDLVDIPWEPESLTLGSGDIDLEPFDDGADASPYSPADASVFNGRRADAQADNGDIDMEPYDDNSGKGGINPSQQAGPLQGPKAQADLAGAMDMDEIRRILRGLTPITVINSTAGSADAFSGDQAQGGPLSDADGTLDGDADVAPPLQQAVMPGQLLTKCGITVYNHPESSGPVNVGDLDDTCFEDIELKSGRRATITIADDAQGLEYLQVTVKGLAHLTVDGDRGLGVYDPRDLEGSKVGIVIEGAGSVSHPGFDRGSVSLRSPGNVVHSLGSSHSHQIDVWSEGNLVKMSGEDAVQVHAPGGDAALGNMVISLHPEFDY